MKKLYVITVLLVCAIAALASPVQAVEVRVEVADLNAGYALPAYSAGDTLRIVGAVPLNAAGWETLRNASVRFALILDNGQTSIPDNAMALNSTAPTSVTGARVTQVGKGAFRGCISLERVSFPALTTIDDDAFYACARLESITLSNVSSLGRNAFQGCENLRNVSMPSVESIPNGAFLNCRALTSLSLPRAKTIGQGAFESNSSLTTVSLPAATIVDSRAFYRASSLAEISLPSVTEIRSEAFAGCTALRILRLGNANPSVSENAFQGVGRITIYSNRTSLTSRNYPPYDLATSNDSAGGGCDATAANAGLFVLLCAALFLKRKSPKG